MVFIRSLLHLRRESVCVSGGRGGGVGYLTLQAKEKKKLATNLALFLSFSGRDVAAVCQRIQWERAGKNIEREVTA